MDYCLFGLIKKSLHSPIVLSILKIREAVCTAVYSVPDGGILYTGGPGVYRKEANADDEFR